MKIRLSELAIYKTEKLLQYLEEHWSRKVKEDFLERFSNRLNILKRNPYSFPESTIKGGVRRLVIAKQTIALYAVQEDTIFVITIFDTRQNPEKIAKEIRDFFQ